MKIVNSYSENKIWRIENRVKSLLKIIPQKEIRGLYSIVLVDKLYPLKIETLGRYHPREKTNPPRIELAIVSIFEGMPKVFGYFPFITNILLGKILYHEIGHHYQTENISQKKVKWGKYANSYATKMLEKKYYWLKIILKPIAIILKLMKYKKTA